MNSKILHSKFQIDLDVTSINRVEENNWFNQQLFAKYTYPFSIVLDEENKVAFAFITDLFVAQITTLYDVLFEDFNVQHLAVMEIVSCLGDVIEVKVRYGLEDFPNFKKKLSKLTFPEIVFSGSIYDHAETVIAQGYPAVKYNFPQVFTDKFPVDEPQWQAFEGLVNNYKNGSFLINEYDIAEDVQLNRNILQPMPYLLHVLQVGFAEADKVLAGDILDDVDFQKATIYSLSEYYSTINASPLLEFTLNTDEHTGIADGFGVYEKEIIISDPGRYKLSGNLYVRSEGTHLILAHAYIYYKNEVVGYWSIIQGENFVLLDIDLEVLPGETGNVLKIYTVQLPYQHLGGQIIEDAVILDASIAKLATYDANGTAQPTLIFPSDINLSKCLPDITFGEFVETVMLWKNLDIKVTETTVYMNKITNQLAVNDSFPLVDFEIAFPKRNFNQGESFELKFADVESDVYSFPSIYIEKGFSSTVDYTVKEDTQEIAINAIPLPLKLEGGVQTVHGFVDDDNKLQIALYNGLQGGLNTAVSGAGLSINSIFDTEYQTWFNFLINATYFSWKFKSSYTDIMRLAIRDKVFAYSKNHIIKKLIRKNVSQNVIETTIELASL